MPALARFDKNGRLAIITLDHPPVNVLCATLVADLGRAVALFEDDLSFDGLVIAGTARAFSAGGDMVEFAHPDFTPRVFNDILRRIEASDRPVAALIEGVAFGGGLEIALACHLRIATQTASFAMPEVMLDILPGSEGTQRLPRLVGLKCAADMMMRGKPVGAQAAQERGLIDAIAPDRDAALALIQSRLDQGRRTSDRAIPDRVDADAIIQSAERMAAKTVGHSVHTAIVTALKAALDEPFDTGCEIEHALFMQLKDTTASQALRHVFLAEREARQLPNFGAETKPRPISRVGIVGVGTMGAGIAVAFANAGFPVTLVETTSAALAKGLDHIGKTYDATVKRGLIDQQTADTRRGLMRSTTDIADLADADLVIEAVFEDMELKLDVAARIGAATRPGTIIATNTSTLDVDRIAQATGKPEDVIGTHFFSPAHIMKLLEIVRGAKTAPEVLKTAMSIAARTAKTPVVSGVCYGFIGNRMAEVYGRENEAMQLEGATPTEIDGVAEDPDWIGMAMGPSRMLDMAGVDVGAKTVIEWMKSGAGPSDPAYRVLCRTMYEMGLHGQKTASGYYLYDGPTASRSPRLSDICKDLAQEYGIARRSKIDADEIFERLLFPMVNEAAKILEEGIAYRPSDIDVIWTSGYGFPRWRGGPLFMADHIGLARIVERLDVYAARNPGSPYWKVSPLLRDLAETSGRILDWQRPQ